MHDALSTDMVAQLKMMQDSDGASPDFTENLAESSASQSEAAQPTAMDEESDQELLDIYLKHLQQRQPWGLDFQLL